MLNEAPARRAAPIGVFDSGVGGLSILREIRQLLPADDLIYVADSGHAPYGDKSAEFVRTRSRRISQFLVDEGVKAVVVACNTATGLAVDDLRARFTLPIVAIEPAVKPAAARSRAKRVGVLATAGTLGSARFSSLVETFARDVEVLSQPCPGLMEQVEGGDFSGPATRALIAAYVEPLLAAGADTLVLGCTHYSFLAPTIRDVAGAGVELLDPAPAVAAELRRRLEANHLQAPASRQGTARFITTGSLSRTRDVLALLWPAPIVSVEHQALA